MISSQSGECYLFKNNEDKKDSLFEIDIVENNSVIYYLEHFGWGYSTELELEEKFILISKLENIDTTDLKINKFIKNAIKDLLNKSL